MKKYGVLFIVLMFSILLSAYSEEIIPVSSEVVNIRVNSKGTQKENDVISHTVALLAEDAKIVINSMDVAHYDQKGNLIAVRGGVDADRVSISKKLTMREMHGFTVTVQLVDEQEDGVRSVIENLDYDIVGIGSIEAPTAISETFYDLYKTLADNFETSYLRSLPFQRPSMLILTQDSEQFNSVLEPYVKWKKAKGYDISIVKKSEIGANPDRNQIRSFIKNFYSEAEIKPEFLLLIGNARGGNAGMPMPAFEKTRDSEICATDLPYTMIEGEDYLPEMIVGRFSVSNDQDLSKIVAKTVAYEKNPYMVNTEWMERALIVGANYSSTSPMPVTPVLMSQWLADLYNEVGYTEVDTVFWRPETGDGGNGTGRVMDSLNKGAQIVSYRGWGDANGWHYPEFRINHLERYINSGLKMPVVTSIVCNTGDYGSKNLAACFGEYWMLMGTQTNLNGAVAFLGPSYLYTSTEFNNSISVGTHWGMQKEGISTFGAAAIRGKLELYKSYPLHRDLGNEVEFYFHVYNVLSDPSLKVWSKVPNRMSVDLPTAIDRTQNHIAFDAPNLSGGSVTITRDNINYELYKIENERALIPLNPEDSGDIKITITKENYVPIERTIKVDSAGNIALKEHNFGNTVLLPGDEITLSATLKNYSSADVSDVIATLSTNATEYVTIIDNEVNFGAIKANSETNGSFKLQVSPECPRHQIIEFTLNIAPTNETAKLQALIGGLLIDVKEGVVKSSNGILMPGATENIEVTIQSLGEVDVHNLTAKITPKTDAVTLANDTIEFGNILASGEAAAQFSVTAQSDAFVGRQVYFHLEFKDDRGFEAEAYFNITIGDVDNTAPTGPDAYGYYAYDSNDKDYDQVPVYEWINIDPKEGGAGTDRWTNDDESFVIDLPFTFRYYGIDYNEVNICSNGWISFIPTWEANFRNWPIPAPLNPKGIIAALWDDLKGLKEVDSQVRLAYHYDVSNNRFIISWLDTYNIGNLTSLGLEKFQIILEPKNGEDGNIIFQYHTLWNLNSTRNYSSTGIMNHRSNVGLEYSYASVYPASASPLKGGMAVKFTTTPPDNYVSADMPTLPVTTTKLNRNYPNPFNPETTIEFDLSVSSKVQLEVYNIIGQKIRTLVDNNLETGRHSYVWNGKDDLGRDVGSGVYLYKLKTPSTTDLRRMILIK
ncbi:MAG: C25 family cysteine peptidase [Candidatus Cloacimonadia bacterium]